MHKCRYCGKTSKSEIKILQHMIKCKEKKEKNSGYDTDYSMASSRSIPYTKPTQAAQVAQAQRTHQVLQVSQPDSRPGSRPGMLDLDAVEKVNTLTTMIHDQEAYYTQKITDITQEFSRHARDSDVQITTLREQVRQLNTAPLRESQMSNQFTKDIIQRDIEIAKLKQSVEGLQKTLHTNEQFAKTQLEKQLVHSNSKYEIDMANAKSSYETKLANLQHTLTQSQTESQHLMDITCKALRDKYEKIIEVRCRDLETKVQTLEADKLFLTREKNMVATEMANKYKSLENEMGFVKLRNDQITAAHEKHIQTSSAEIDHLKHDKAADDLRYKQEVKDASTRTATLTMVLEELRGKHSSIQAELTDYRANSTRECSELSAQNRQFKQQNQYLKDLYDKTVVEHEKLLKTDRTAKDAKAAELMEAVAEVEHYKETIRAFKASAQKTHAQSDQTTAELDKLKKTHENLKEERNFIQSRFESMETQIRDLTAKNASFLKENNATKATHRELTETLIKNSKENQQLKLDATLLKSSYNKLLESTQLSVKDEHEIIAHLKSELAKSEKLKQDNATLLDSLASSDTQLKNIELKHLKIKDEWNRFQQEHIRVIDAANVLKSEAKEHRSIRESQASELREKEMKLSDLARELQTSQFTVRDLQKDKDILVLSITGLEQKQEREGLLNVRLREKLREFEDECIRLKGGVKEKEDMLSGLKTINSNLAQTIHGKERDANMMIDRNAVLAAQLKNLRVDFEGLKATYDEIQMSKIEIFKNHASEIGKYKDMLRKANGDLEVLKSGHKQENITIDSLRSKDEKIMELQQANKLLVELNKKSENIYGQLHTETTREINQLHSSAKKLELQLCDVTEKYNKIRSRDSEIDALKSDNQSLREQSRDQTKLSKDHAALTDRFHALVEELKESQSTLNQLKVIYTKTEEQRTHYFELSESLKSAKSDLEQLTIEHGKTSASLSELKGVAQKTQLDLFSSTKDSTTLKREYGALQTDMERLKTLYTRELHQLKGVVCTAQTTLADYRVAMKNLESENTKLKSDACTYSSLQNSYNKLTLSLKSSDKELARLSEENRNITESLNKSDLSNKELRQDKILADKSMVHLKDQQKAKSDALKETIKNLNSQVNALTDGSVQLAGEIEGLREKLVEFHTTQRDHENLKAQLVVWTSNSVQMSEEKTKLQQNLEIYKTKHASITVRVDTLESANKQLMDKIHAITASNKSIAVELKEKTDAYRDLSDTYASRESLYTEESSRYNQIQSKINDIVHERNTLSKANDELLTKLQLTPSTQEFRDILKQKTDTQSDNINLLNKMNRLNSEIAEQKKLVVKLRAQEETAIAQTRELQNSKKELAQVYKRVDECLWDISRLAKNQEALEADKASQSKVIEKLETKIVALSKLPDKLKNQILTLRTESTTLLQSYVTREKELMEQLHDREVEFNYLCKQNNA
jgi:chromosome segregation ATPase